MCAFARCVRLQAWATGGNEYGQLGLGDTTGRSTPVQLPSPTNIVQVATGGYHTVLLDGSGVVRAILLLLSVAWPPREHEWCLGVCGLDSFAVLFASRVVCWGAGESLSWAGEDSLHRTIVIICVARSRLIAPASCT
eukprot:COSAG06_NODE_20804_length_780_cov_1.682819_2_plen_137_part_00